MLRVEECAAGYGAAPVFDRLSFSVKENETLAVVGPSGCGKSTLLAVIAGIKQPWAGKIRLDNEPVQRGDRRIGLILQSYGLFPWMTVEQNVALGLRFRKVAASRRRSLAAEELERLEIEHLSGRYPAELSGGQQQRVAIARTFAVGPRLLLMDEPFSALDTITRERLQDALVRRIAGGRVITLFVTHSIDEAVYLGQRLLIFRPGSPATVSLLDNDHDLEPGFRMDSRFFDRCREVRAVLEGADRGPAARRAIDVGHGLEVGRGIDGRKRANA